jgi:hypothetical protein
LQLLGLRLARVVQRLLLLLLLAPVLLLRGSCSLLQRLRRG